MGYKESGNGVSTRGGVRTTMNQPVGKSIGKGEDNVRAGGAFDTPGHDVGGGGIPCHTFVDMGESVANTVSPPLASPGTIATDPTAKRRYAE